MAAPSRAQSIPGYPENVLSYDPREVAMLPAFCRHTQGFRESVPGGNDPVQVQRWRGTLGGTFEHLHHYCWGLMKSNRGAILARDGTTRAAYLSDANREFQYVLERAGEDFVLLPEILTKRGDNLVKLRRGHLAVVDYERALLIKADYWPAYAGLADYFAAAGDKGKAREVLERGLAAAPDATALTRRLDDLRSGTRKAP